MIQKLFNALSPNPIDFWAYALGVGLVFFATLWGGVAVYDAVKKPRSHRAMMSGVLILVATAIGSGVFIYLTASTPVRRAFINLPMHEMAMTLIQVAIGLALAVAALAVIYNLAGRWGNNSDIRFGIVASIGIVLTIGVTTWALYAMTFSPDLDVITAPPPDIAAIQIVDGIGVKVFENKVTQKPTALAVGPNKELYVASIEGYIWVMQDFDQDGVADNVIKFAKGLQKPEGLAWSKDGLYVTTPTQLLLLIDTNGDYVADETKVIPSGFPGEQYAFHQANGLTFGLDGRLYIGVGSTTDHRPETHPLAARILSINPDGSDLQVYATGLRNPFALVPAPGGGLFAIDNGSSGCIDTAVKIDDCSHKIDVPEELNYITQGNDYGFPKYFGIPPQDSGTMPPVVTFPDHGTPAGLVLYEGDKLPEKYKDRLFVSLFTRNEIYSVQVFRVDAQHFVGASRLFSSGILGPTAMVNAPSGGLYVASFTGSTIYSLGGIRELPSATPTVGTPIPSDPATGQRLFAAVCATCHGPVGEGIAKLGKDLTQSAFASRLTDDELVVFIKKGRDPSDPLDTTGETMPPKGGHPELTDQDLYNIVAYLRMIQK